MNDGLLLEILDPVMALAQRNTRALALLHVQVASSMAAAANGELSGAIRDAVRDADLVARLAQDRYAVALVEIWGPDAAVRVAQRVVQAVDELADGGAGVRIGVSFYPGDAEYSLDLLDAAIRATPDVDPIGFADPAMGHDALRRAGLLRELNGRRTASQFRLHYQPIRTLHDGRAVGAEALVRWDRGGSLVPAAEFIGLARSTGRIRAIELWTMKRAFREVRRWREHGWNGWMSINLSGRSLVDPTLPEITAGLLEASGTPAESILFEVTERSALAGDSASLGTLEALRDLGTQIAVDDFGAGYASFEYLCDFDPDLVKLDRAFTTRPRVSSAEELLDVLVDVAHRLGKPVVVEGVEDQDQLDRVAATGCEFVQGYFTGRPVPGTTFLRRYLDCPPAALLEATDTAA
jgi:EAL domain-containing protein (putative c-di-GMP-specific phosphodiesterase class I)